MSSDAQARIEAYLMAVRSRLRGLNREEVREIVSELRSHIVERAAGTLDGVDAALAALGSADALANEYITEALLARAEATRSPWHVLESLFRRASLSVAGFLVLLGAIAAYFAGGAFMLCALLKPFHPHTAGLWILPGDGNGIEISLRLGFGNIPEGGREVLGWWIVPVGLVIGCGLVMLTTRVALWWVGRRRRPAE
jgi:hypothetical protein